MSIPGVHDPDFTLIDLGQTTHFGSSGTLVSDEELNCASGVLQVQIDNIESASGIIEIINQPDVINNLASGISSLLRFDLSLNADDDTVNHTTFFNIPVAEYDNLQTSRWNLKTPVGGVSGLVFDMSWFHESTQTGEFSFSVVTRQLPSGANVSTITPITSVISESGTFTKDILNINEVKIEIDIPGLQDVSLELVRNSASLLQKVRAVSYGIIYKASGSL